MSVANLKSSFNISAGNLVFYEKVTGNGASTQFGIDDSGVDVIFYGDTSGAYMMWDESADQLKFVGGATLSIAGTTSFGDDVALTFGASADVSIEWDTAATPDQLQITPAADDTVLSIGVAAATQKSFDVKIFGGAANGADYFTFDAGASSLIVGGDSRIDFSSATTLAANTDGGIIKAGTSGAPVTEDTADMKFISLYFDDGATSGDARGIYNRLYITGAGGGGESLRSYTTVSNVAGANAHGAHISLSFGASGSITGQGAAVRATLEVPDVDMSAGTYYAGLSEVYFTGTTASLDGTTLHSIHHFQVYGAGGYTNDMEYVFSFAGLNSTQFEGTYSATPNKALKININGTAHWIACSTATS